VIAVDTNILVYAHREDSDWFEPAVAIVTHPRIFKRPTPAPLAIAQVDAWLESPSLVVMSENEPYLEGLRDVLLASRVTGARVHDARVAALCVSHGIRELWTADRDFSMFPQLKTRNPLVRRKSRS